MEYIGLSISNEKLYRSRKEHTHCFTYYKRLKTTDKLVRVTSRYVKEKTKVKELTLSITVKNGKNPVPYIRTTSRQKFVDKNYKRYQEYKNLIYAEFVKKYMRHPHQMIDHKEKIYVHIMAYYKDKTHGDTDNIAKAANDAIFQKPLNDKYVAGSYDYAYDKQEPRLEIHITTDRFFK